MNLVELFPADDCRAEVFILPAAPVIDSSVKRFRQHTPEGCLTPVHAVSFPDMLHGSPLADSAFKVIESVLDNPGFFRQDFQPLFPVDPIPERAGAGNDGSVGNLAVKYNVYPFPTNVSFILGD